MIQKFLNTPLGFRPVNEASMVELTQYAFDIEETLRLVLPLVKQEWVGAGESSEGMMAVRKMTELLSKSYLGVPETFPL